VNGSARRRTTSTPSVRVGAEDQQVVGPVEIRDGNRRAGPEHQRRRHLLGELIDRARRIQVAGGERSEQHSSVEQVGQVVGVRIAEIDGHPVAVLGQDRGQPLVDLGERLIPAGRSVAAIGPADQRPADTVGIGVQLLERKPLRSDEAVAEDIVAVAPDRDHVLALEVDREPTCRLAQRTGANRGSVAVGRHRDHGGYGADGLRADARRSTARTLPRL
jgi:hypothetical protein